MSSISRLQKAYEGALRLPLTFQSKYVLFSDCHRGVGNTNDNLLKNQALCTAALGHYCKTGFTCVELGDGDELWENRALEPIIDAHSSIFRLLKDFYVQNRLYLLYGNHDIVKAKIPGLPRRFCTWPCCCQDPRLENQELFPNLKYYEAIILDSRCIQHGPDIPEIFLVHGHQADTLNSTFWPLARFLVRYVWKPLERSGIQDPTSAAKNYSRKRKTEDRLHDFARCQDLLLIAGHTHRPLLTETDLSYCNCGSCVHPYTITCIEIEQLHISLVKWQLNAAADMKLCVMREILAGPFSLPDAGSSDVF